MLQNVAREFKGSIKRSLLLHNRSERAPQRAVFHFQDRVVSRQFGDSALKFQHLLLLAFACCKRRLSVPQLLLHFFVFNRRQGWPVATRSILRLWQDRQDLLRRWKRHSSVFASVLVDLLGCFLFDPGFGEKRRKTLKQYYFMRRGQSEIFISSEVRR